MVSSPFLLAISCISPVQIVWSVPGYDGHWDVEDVIDGQLEKENKVSKTKLQSVQPQILIKSFILNYSAVFIFLKSVHRLIFSTLWFYSCSLVES